jgi:hypothetical protein
VAPLSAIPPVGRPRGWSLIPWADVRTALEHGKAVCFQVRRDQVVPFWKTAQAQLGRPIRVRRVPKRKHVKVAGTPIEVAVKVRA